MVRSLLAVTAALVVSAPASAGPILWTYNATFGADGGPGWLLFNTSADRYRYPDGSVPAFPTPSWKFDNYGFGSGGVFAGNRSDFSVIGFTTPDGYGLRYTDVPAGVRSTNEFRLTFSITDNASGQTASTSWTGTVTMHYHVGDTPGDVVPAAVLWDIGPPTLHTWTLGGNRYQVDLFTQLDGQADALFANVRLNPTPEPAMLLLAGIGVGGLGALRRLRLV
jgi:hypothetical protein